MKKKILVLSWITTTLISNALTPYYPKLSGYIKSEYWYDSRQIVSLRDGEYLLYPAARTCDALGQDTNATGQFNGSIIQTRTRLEFDAPEIHRIKPAAVFEADFFGTAQTSAVFRPRHLYATLTQNYLTFLAGQTWQPLFVADCSPDTIGFNTGAPLEPFGRQSQLRCTLNYKGFEIFGAMLYQLESLSNGPFGNSSQYIRNGMIPNLHAQCIYHHTKGDFEGSLIGAAIDFLHLTPRLITNKNLYAQEHVNATRCIAFGKLKYKKFIAKLKGIYAENAHDLVMLGGYGVTHIDPVTDHRSYTPTRTVAAWGEFIYKSNIEPGIFLGWSKNCGTRKKIIQSLDEENLLYTRNADINTVIRVSPRVRWYLNPCIIALETEYTRATYGTVNDYARPINTYPVSNIRIMGSVYYTF